MATAFVNQTSGTSTGATSTTFTGPTVSGAFSIGFVSVSIQTDFAGMAVTWGGVACTFLNGKTEAAFGVERLELWAILNPSSAGSIVISRSGSSNVLAGKGTSYSGTTAFALPTKLTTNELSGATPMTTTLNSVATNSWTIINARSDAANLTAGAGTTLRGTYNNHGVFDSNGIVSGTTSLVVDDASGGGDIWGCMAAFGPAATADINSRLLMMFR